MITSSKKGKERTFPLFGPKEGPGKKMCVQAALQKEAGGGRDSIREISLSCPGMNEVFFFCLTRTKLALPKHLSPPSRCLEKVLLKEIDRCCCLFSTVVRIYEKKEDFLSLLFLIVTHAEV